MSLLPLAACTVPDYAHDETFGCDGDRQCATGFVCDRQSFTCREGDAWLPDAGWMPDAQALDRGQAQDLGQALDGGAADAQAPDGAVSADLGAPLDQGAPLDAAAPTACDGQWDNALCADDGEGRPAVCVAERCCRPSDLLLACNARGPGHPLPFPEDYGDDAYNDLPGGGVEHRTGLRWALQIAAVASPEDGQAWCDGLPWDPQVGRWRLPDWHELATLQRSADGGAPPAWLRGFLSPMGDSMGLFVSRTRLDGDVFVYNPRIDALQLKSQADAGQVYALCVARPRDLRDSAAWPVQVGLGARDEWTGREWADYVETVRYADAQALCGQNGDGLPTVAELGSLMDFSHSPPLDRITGAAHPKTYWTQEQISGVVRVVDFATGAVVLDGTAAQHHVRCVVSRER